MEVLIQLFRPADQSMAVYGISIYLLVLLGAAGIGIVGLAALGKVPFRYNVRNLTVRWKTTLLTAFAFTAVIALLTAMLAFVNGMYRLTDNSGRADNVIILSEGSTDEVISNLGFSDVGDIENQPGVARQQNQPLCSRETYLVVNQLVREFEDGSTKRRFLSLRGLDDPGIAAFVHELTLAGDGQWFSDAGVREIQDGDGKTMTAIEAVLGLGVARELGSDRSDQQIATARNAERLDVGDTFRLGDRQWVIVGIMQSRGSTFDSEIWAKRGLVGPLFGKETLTSLVLRTEDAATASRLTTFFNDDYEKASLQAFVEKDYFASLAGTNQQFLYATIFVTLVMSVGGVFGVMNTMFAAISQRIKDIGVLRLLGYARRQILMSFLLESLLIALLGGALGCLIGSLCDGQTATSIVSSGRGGGGKMVVLEFTVTANTIAFGMALAVFMGTLGGLFPALSAVRLRALEALR